MPMAGFGQLDLWRLAGQRSYERGERYVDAVVDLRDTVAGVRATVHGSDPYRVRLSWADGRLVGDCSCPVGREGAFCKHCVAVGLVLVDSAEENGADDEGGAAEGGAAPPRGDLRGYLESLEHETLVDLLCEQAAQDDALHRTLTLRAARDREEPDVAALRREIDGSLQTRGYVSYDGSYEYASRAGDVVDVLDELLEAGHAAEVVALAQRVVDLVAAAMEQIDDSSGQVGGVCAQAAEVHARACAEAPPAPAALARWLLEVQLGDRGWPDLAVADYADALGEPGMRLYRQEVEARWRALPARDRSSGYVAGYWAVTRLMEQLAALDGVDALVEVLAADLSSTWQYVRIATALAAEQRHSDALAWVERGLHEQEQAWSDQRLVDVAVELHLALGRRAEAVAVRRGALEAGPTFERYRQLRELATDLPESAQARGLLRGVELVRALHADGEHDQAWAAAQDAHCPAALWQELAERRAERHPLDAAAVFRRLAATRIEHRNKDGYAAAAELIARVGRLYERAAPPGEFTGYLDEIKAAHRQKRNFMAALAARGM
jgi:uncharacterized Zn finger protein